MTVFDQTVIPLEGGQTHLRLKKPLNLRYDPATRLFAVKDWGIEIDSFQLAELPREIARKFLHLLGAAEAGSLTATEQAELVRISDYVDFREFSVIRSAPRYMEGTLQTWSERVIVEWHDGTREVLDWVVARALSEVNPGERFSAFVKIGAENKSLKIERVSFLPSPAEHEDWEQWPRKDSSSTSSASS